jgi:uncharacterized protein
MGIKITDIPEEGLTVEFNQKLDLFDQGKESTAFTAVLNIKPTGGGVIHLEGKVESKPLLECSRCLKNFSYNIDSEFAIDAAPISAMNKTPEHELTGGELETEFFQGDEIEPLEFIKEQLLISVPMVPVHSPDCKGLCPVCGMDLNTGNCNCDKDGDQGFGPFSGLKDLLKK